jgi:hypothetical protein
MPQLEHVVTQLLLAIPNPSQWSGPAALACSVAIEALADELRRVQAQLGVEWSIGSW